MERERYCDGGETRDGMLDRDSKNSGFEEDNITY